MGALFVATAYGIHQVNADRDGQRGKFIIPTKQGISESEKPLEYRLYAAFFFVMGFGFALIAILFLKQWPS
jgi:hypothetical protein